MNQKEEKVKFFANAHDRDSTLAMVALFGILFSFLSILKIHLPVRRWHTYLVQLQGLSLLLFLSELCDE